MIYVHIPFCSSKCYYCNFCSNNYSKNIQEKYFQKLLKEIEQNKNKKLNITSIYIGGGTPSFVNSKYIVEIIKNIKKYFTLDNNCEISIEANPNSITKEKLVNYKNIGINRISFGVQSLNNKCLKLIGRKHTKSDAINAIKLAKECGFTNINADLLIGIPNQRYIHLIKSAKKLLKLGITHMSCYMLINEKGTILTNKIESKELRVVSEDLCVKYYQKLVRYLQNHNFCRYEISNFSPLGYECKHNIGYWNMTDYLGFGLSAHSFFDDNRYSNCCDINKYIENDIEYKKEKITNQEKVEEMVMLGLRTKFGVSIKKLLECGYDIQKERKNELNMLEKNNFIKIENDTIKVCDDKFGVCNQIILKLI